MKKYSNGKRVISATDRAFEVIYKAQGFFLIEDEEAELFQEERTEETQTIGKVDYKSLKVDELKELAKETGITGYSDMKKTELIAALEGVIND